MTTEPKTIEVEANGIRFTCLEQGEGQLMLCLHGFPDDATTWRHQMPVFAKAGYRVVAPYMRGYAPTSPSPIGVYQSAALGHDVAALLRALAPGQKSIVVGHDWGAIAAYGGALFAADHIEKLITSAVPYGPSMAMAFTTDYVQQKRSWYIFFFQTLLADMAVANDDLRFIRNLWRDWSPSWKHTEADIASTLETLAKPGVLDAALGYYRCMFNPALQAPELAEDQGRMVGEPITVPTLYLLGPEDGCMGMNLADGMEASFPAGLTKVVIEGTGHFMHREKADDVSAQILKFLGK